MWLRLIFAAICFETVLCGNRTQQCHLLAGLVEEIKGYESIVDEIIAEAIHGKSKGFVYNELLEFVDLFGNRLAGSSNLEKSIDYMLKKLKDLGLDNVHGEIVLLPTWVR